MVNVVPRSGRLSTPMLPPCASAAARTCARPRPHPRGPFASAIVKWDPHINWIIDEWWKVKAEGGKFDAPKEPKWFTWQEGSGDVALNKSWEEKIHAEVKKLVDETIAAIKSGAKTIALNLNEVKSD